jgi:hypothetical protein
MTNKEEEKRQYPRLNLHTPLRYQVRGNPQFDNAVSDNISAGGLSFTTHSFIPPDTNMMLQFNVLSRVLRIIARVAWASPLPHSYRNRLGLQFLEAPAEDMEFLNDYINMQLSQA